MTQVQEVATEDLKLQDTADDRSWLYSLSNDTVYLATTSCYHTGLIGKLDLFSDSLYLGEAENPEVYYAGYVKNAHSNPSIKYYGSGPPKHVINALQEFLGGSLDVDIHHYSAAAENILHWSYAPEYNHLDISGKLPWTSAEEVYSAHGDTFWDEKKNKSKFLGGSLTPGKGWTQEWGTWTTVPDEVASKLDAAVQSADEPTLSDRYTKWIYDPVNHKLYGPTVGETHHFQLLAQYPEAMAHSDSLVFITYLPGIGPMPDEGWMATQNVPDEYLQEAQAAVNERMKLGKLAWSEDEEDEDTWYMGRFIWNKESGTIWIWPIDPGDFEEDTHYDRFSHLQEEGLIDYSDYTSYQYGYIYEDGSLGGASNAIAPYLKKWYADNVGTNWDDRDDVELVGPKSAKQAISSEWWWGKDEDHHEDEDNEYWYMGRFIWNKQSGAIWIWPVRPDFEEDTHHNRLTKLQEQGQIDYLSFNSYTYGYIYSDGTNSAEGVIGSYLNKWYADNIGKHWSARDDVQIVGPIMASRRAVSSDEEYDEEEGEEWYMGRWLWNKESGTIYIWPIDPDDFEYDTHFNRLRKLEAKGKINFQNYNSYTYGYIYADGSSSGYLDIVPYLKKWYADNKGRDWEDMDDVELAGPTEARPKRSMALRRVTAGKFLDGFGFFDGKLYIADLHHADIIKRLIADGYTWNDLVEKPSVFGWLQHHNQSGEKDTINVLFSTGTDMKMNVGFEDDDVREQALQAISEHYNKPAVEGWVDISVWNQFEGEVPQRENDYAGYKNFQNKVSKTRIFSMESARAAGLFDKI
jgi:hypothetical protein